MTKHGEVTTYATQAAKAIDDSLLGQRAVAITWLSVIIHKKYPVIPRETRRQVAARCLEAERKRRKDQQKETNEHATE